MVQESNVALYMSAWIEITNRRIVFHTYKDVALYMSAWIEILLVNPQSSTWLSRTLHECVD